MFGGGEAKGAWWADLSKRTIIVAVPATNPALYHNKITKGVKYFCHDSSLMQVSLCTCLLLCSLRRLNASLTPDVDPEFAFLKKSSFRTLQSQETVYGGRSGMEESRTTLLLKPYWTGRYLFKRGGIGSQTES
jgi:hypothetical protein